MLSILSCYSGFFNEMTVMYDLDSQHSSPTAEPLMCLCGPPVQTALTVCIPLAELQELCDIQKRCDVLIIYTLAPKRENKASKIKTA